MNDVETTWNGFDPKIRRISMVGLALAMLMACLDGTIVGTCGPIIAAELNGTELYAWMITIYLLCETVMIPISGKMSDHFGRKPIFLAGLIIFVVGSMLAGTATSMEQMLVFRGMQGLGGGTLIPVAMAAVADFYGPEERGKIQGILGAVFGLGSAVGPLLGGYITDIASWNWVFYINIPIAIVALVLTVKKFPKAEVDVLHKVDYLGMSVLTLFIIDLLLFFEWGGDEIQWVSMESFAMILIGVVIMAIFIFIEKRADDPVLAPHLIHNKTIVACAIFMALFGLGMMGAMTYTSMFNIYVFGLTPLEAAEISIAMVVGMMITSLSSGSLLSRTGHKPWLLAGPIITAAALWFMSTIKYGSDLNMMIVALFFLGLGLGCMMSVVMVVTQNHSKSNEIGMTTSAVNLMRSIGSTIGTAVFAMFVNNTISGELAENLPTIFDQIPHDVGILDPMVIQKVIEALGMDGYDAILTSFANSVDMAFLYGGFIVIVLVVIGLLIKSDKHKETNTDNE